jgi:type I restriction enzyme S subunit
MKVRSRDKQTEVGTIPEDWEIATVGSLASFTSGVGISVASLREESADNPVPVYGGNGVAGFTRRALLTEPSVAVGRVGQKCGEVYATDGPAWVTDNALYPARIRRPLDIGFLALALQRAGLNDLKNRNDLPLVTQAILHSVRLPWPADVSEQHTIAGVLADVDALLAGLNLVIAKKRDLKQAAMQKLLTGQIRLPGFHGEWETTRLGDVAATLRGSGLSKQLVGLSGRRPCILYGELFTTYGRTISTVLGHTDSVGGRESVSGDVLMPGSTTTTGSDLATASALLIGGVALGGDINIIRNRTNSYNPAFLANYLTTVRRSAIAELAQGITIHHLYARDLSTLVLFLPRLQEQTAIAEVLSDMDAELAALEARREKTRALKQAMMQELLTGRVRLV